jgi:hypothetical protein
MLWQDRNGNWHSTVSFVDEQFYVTDAEKEYRSRPFSADEIDVVWNEFYGD